MSPTKPGARRPQPPTPSPEFYSIRRLDQVRALAHPLRFRLLELFGQEPRTTKQAAEILGEKPTRLYHHVARLEEVGLIRLRETRRKRGTTEKYYEAVAQAFSVDDAVFRSRRGRLGSEPKRQLAVSLLEEARAELAATTKPLGAKNSPSVMRLKVRGPASRLEGFRDDFVAWVSAWAEQSESGGKAAELTLTMALVPSTGPSPSRRSRRPRGKLA